MEVLLTVLLFLWQIGWVALLGGVLCALALWLIPALRKRKKSAFAACVLAVLLLLAGLCLRPIVIGGSGAQRGTSPTVCPDCRGTGQVSRAQRTPFGVMQTQTACPRCQGRGRVIEHPCSSCGGQGKVRKTEEVGINIPAGIADGQVITIPNMGNAGQNGGPAGDLNVQVTVRPHPLFERDGFDIWYELPITFAQAALGAEVEIPTLDGKMPFTIKEGTQPGEVLRVRGKGIPYLRGRGVGDLLLKIVVEVPRSLTKEQKKLLEEFDSSTGDKQYQKRRNFFDKLKDVFN